MSRTAALIFATFAGLYAPAVPAGDNALPASAHSTLVSRIDAAISDAYRSGEPGAVVIVTKDGEPVFRKAYGAADVVTHAPLTPRTAMPIGSMTKQFTAVAVMMLAESGKLAVGDAITRYLPDYPTQGKSITIEHLLTHSSGIPDYTAATDWRSKMAQDLSTGALIDSFKQLPLAFEPGTRYAYSNSNYILLGKIIEKVSGKPYASFVEERIFVPLGMDDTGYASRTRGNAPIAAGHTLDERGFVHSGQVSVSQLYASGGLVSTVDDLARWNAAIGAGKLLSAAGWNKVFTPYRPRDGRSQYGYGFQIDDWQQTRTIRHGGRIDGFETFAMRLPEQGLFVAVLSNLDGGRTPPDQIARRAALAAMGRESPAPTLVTVDDELFDTYVGRYRMTQPPIVIDISRSAGKYLASATGQGSFELKPVSTTRFLAEAAGAELQFDKDEDGAVNRITLLQGPRRMTAIRVAQPDSH
jgi:CubicO group peptidase (beta-lactamase class C family)